MAYLIDHTPEHRTGLYDVPERPIDHTKAIARINARIDAILSGKKKSSEPTIRRRRDWKPREDCTDWEKTSLAVDCLTMTAKELSVKYDVPEGTIRNALRTHDLVAKKGYRTREGNK